jgi:outer membrane receptor protein involved in Fe transport
VWALLLSCAAATPGSAQSGSVRGTVADASDGGPLEGVRVEILRTRFTTLTGPDGAYSLAGIAPGTYTVRFDRLGYVTVERGAEVGPGAAGTLDVRMVARASADALAGQLPTRIADRATTRPAALVVAELPGVHVGRSGFNRFIVTPRSFMQLANRRMLVRVDGRDLGANAEHSPEWAALDLWEPRTELELIRGPASARFGPNAAAGVLDIRTPAARETTGARMSVGVGTLDSRDVRARWGGVTDDLRWGFRAEGGWSTTRGFDVSRTNEGDLSREYAGARDSVVAAPFPGYELVPLSGQTRTTPDSLPGPVVGEPDPETALHGSLRLDRYLDDGGMITAAGGITRIENQVSVTDGSRLQAEFVNVPWARVAVEQERYDLAAYYGGRTRSAVGLASGAPVEERSSRFHVEGEARSEGHDGAMRMSLGFAARAESLNSKGTLLSSAAEGRTEGYLGVSSRLEWDLRPDLELSVAARLEDSSIWGTQAPSRIALVWHAGDTHAFRASAADGHVPPTVAEEFARVRIAQPVDLLGVEALIRGSPLGPSMSGVPDGELFTNSTAVPFLAIGNQKLEPETVEEFAVGYTGRIGRTVVTADVRRAEYDAFRTELLPGVNPDYGPWTAPAAIQGEAGLLVGAFARDLVAGLTRLEDGRTAIVYARTNAGRASEWGLDLAFGVQLTDEVEVRGGWSVVSVDVEDDTFIDRPRLSNTPRHLTDISASWAGPGGVHARIALRATAGFDFRDGVFDGHVPARESLNLDLRGPVGRGVDVAVSVVNALDQQRFHHFGGSVIGRRLIASVVWSP